MVQGRGNPHAEVKLLSAKLGPGEHLALEGGDPTLYRVTLPCRLKVGGGRIWVSDLAGRPLDQKPRPDPILIKALKASHTLLVEGSETPLGFPEGVASPTMPTSPYDRNLSRLAYLAPDIQALILEGRHPPTLTLQRLMAVGVTPSWADQRRVLEIPC